jgi:hypothetical protein
MLKTIVSGLVLAAVGTPVTAAEYWVVKDPATQKCLVVEQQPTTPAIRHAFQRREAAEAAITSSVACGGVD